VLRKAYYGASIMPLEVLKELNERLPNVRFWNLYGQTEIAPLATALQPEYALAKAGSVGKPTLNVESASSMTRCAMWRQAKWARSSTARRSYCRVTTTTLSAPRRCSPVVLFHSGDLGTVDSEGFITVVDRKKDMIKSGGENVASREVEGRAVSAVRRGRVAL